MNTAFCCCSYADGRAETRTERDRWAGVLRAGGDPIATRKGATAAVPSSDPAVTRVVVTKAAQVGYTESLGNIIGFHIDQDPGADPGGAADRRNGRNLVGNRALAP
jgi:hypothetical protein